MALQIRKFHNLASSFNAKVFNGPCKISKYSHIPAFHKRCQKHNFFKQCWNISENRLLGTNTKLFCLINEDEFSDAKRGDTDYVDAHLKYKIDGLSAEEKRKLLLYISKEEDQQETMSINELLTQSAVIINNNNIYQIMDSIKQRFKYLNVPDTSIDNNNIGLLFSKLENLFITCSSSDLIISFEVFCKLTYSADHPWLNKILKVITLKSSEMTVKDILNLNFILFNSRKRGINVCEKLLYLLPVLMEKKLTQEFVSNLQDKELVEIFRYSSRAHVRNCDLLVEEIFCRSLDIIDIGEVLNLLWSVVHLPKYPYNQLIFPSSFSLLDTKLKAEAFSALEKNCHNLTSPQISSLMQLLQIYYKTTGEYHESILDSLSQKINEIDALDINIEKICSLQYNMNYVDKEMIIRCINNLHVDNRTPSTVLENILSAVSICIQNIPKEKCDTLVQCITNAATTNRTDVSKYFLKMVLDLLNMDIYEQFILERVFAPNFIKSHVLTSSYALSQWMLVNHVVDKSDKFRYLTENLPQELKLKCYNYFKNYHLRNAHADVLLSCKVVDDLLEKKVASVLYNDCLGIDRLLIIDDKNNIVDIAPKNDWAVTDDLIHYSDLNLSSDNEYKKFAILHLWSTSLYQPNNMLRSPVSLKVKSLEKAGFCVILLNSSDSREERKHYLRDRLIAEGAW